MSGRTDGETDVALARAVLYEAISRGLRLPSTSGSSALASGRPALAAAAALLDTREPGAEPLADVVRRFVDGARTELRLLASAHARLFGHSLGRVCPFETEYGTGGPLRQPHELADIAGFYLAFGLKPPAGTDERVDHVACECEFMGFLARKEAYVLAAGGHPEVMPRTEAEQLLVTVRQASAGFLRDHLARFGLAFGTRLVSEDGGGFFGALGGLLLRLLRRDCEALGVPAGPASLELRPPASDPTPMACGSSCGTEPELIQIERPVPS